MNKDLPRYIPKEISWLSFNERVLQEAANPQVPIMERVKFLAIFSNNLDEFFRVRVATLKRLADLGTKTAIKAIGYNPREVLHTIQQQALQLNQTYSNVYQEILSELRKHNIYLLNETELNEDQKAAALRYFKESVRPHLFPVILDQVSSFPDLNDQSAYLLIAMSHTDLLHKPKYAIIEIPAKVLGRFFILPERENRFCLMLLDNVIRLGLADIFAIFDFNYFQAYTIKLTRDAELDIDDDINQSYISKMSDSLKLRKEGNPVRFVYDADMPEYLLEMVRKKIGFRPEDVTIPGGRYHNFSDFMKFPRFPNPMLYEKPVSPIEFPHIGSQDSMFKIISAGDILLHFPYHSFLYVIDWLREASIDPRVTAIKMTIYRVAKHSSVLNALISAVKNGKKVTVILELQARFDEEANINWANRLKAEGIKLIFGVPGLKVHAKLVLITRKEKGEEMNYAIIGTGNFNESTSRIYSDHSLLTCDKRLTNEVKQVFSFFERNYQTPKIRHLLLSPFTTRSRILRMIETEIKNHELGKPAYIIWKLNNLVDTEIIEKLYEASQKGVEITLMIRGMYSIQAGIKGLSENITAIGLVDKYLEHTRIFLFANGGRERYFISSADIMTRNLDRRVEVACPIYNKKIQNEVRHFLHLHLQDNIKTRSLSTRNLNQFIIDDSRPPIRAQDAIYEYLLKEAKKYGQGKK
ncbi:MAG TPA: polyphosphate kinase 1 [Candidatus Marinimicrobia bacterium]|nr:polyphosphate kinase 1 [Candidatus Neomarinimicrobiota bacterium]